MPLTKWTLLSGALLGLSGVIAGAFGAHALEDHLIPARMEAYETAVRFQLFHALYLIILGILARQTIAMRLLWCSRTGLWGTLLFSGSIYLLVLSELPVGIITPLGGGLLIVSWGLLAWAVWITKVS